MDVKILFGKRVKELRSALGISREEPAYRADLDRTYTTSVECGRRNISIVNVKRIADALGVTLNEFFYFLGVIKQMARHVKGILYIKKEK